MFKKTPVTANAAAHAPTFSARVKRLGQFLRPPVFPDDEDKTQAAQILHALLTHILILGGVFAVAIIFVFENKTGAFILGVCLLAWVFVLASLAQRGQIKVAARWLVGGLWLLTVVDFLLIGRISLAAVVFQVASVVVAGTLLGPRVALLGAVLSSALGLGVTILALAGHPVRPYVLTPLLADWIHLIIAFTLVTPPLNLTVHGATQALARARQSEKRYVALFEEAPMMYLTVQEKNGVPTITNCNAAFLESLGYARAEVIGHPLADFYTPASQAALLQDGGFQRVVQDRIKVQAERDLVARDGHILHTLLQATPDLDATGQVVGALSSFLDITERVQVETALRESEARLKTVSDNFTDGLIYQLLIKPDGTRQFTYLSAAVQSLYGITPAAGLADARLLYDRVHEEDLARLVAAEEAALKNNATFRAEVRIKDPTGQFRWSVLVSSPTKLEDGATLWNGFEFVITERKHAEEVLRQSEAQLKTVMDNTPDTILWVDRRGVINFTNRLVPGLTAADVIDSSIYKWVPEEQYPTLAAALETVFTHGAPAEYESSGPGPQGTPRLYHVRVAPVLIDGVAVSAVYSATDITARKQAEAELRQSEARYRAVVENQTEMIVRWKPDGTRTFVNEAYLRCFGLTYEQALARNFIPLVVKEDRPAVEAKMARLLAGTVPVETDVHRSTLPNGEIVWQEWTDSAIRDAAGHLVEFQSVGRDITERKIAEDTLYFLAQRGWQEYGEAFFPALARYLGQTLSIDYVFIDHVDREGQTAHTLANYWLGDSRPNFEYALKQTPCENIFGNKLCTYASRIQHLFPQDSILTEMGAESYSGVPLWDSQGQPIGLIALIHRQPLKNISRVETLLQIVADHAGYEIERMETEKILRTSEARYRQLFEGVPVGLYRTAPNGRILDANLAVVRMLGFEARATLLERNLHEFWLSQGEPVNLLSLLGEKDSLDVEVQFKRRDQTVIWVWNRLKAVRDSRGAVVYVEGSLEDITERKRKDEEIAAAHLELQHLLKLSDQSRLTLLSILEDEKAVEDELHKLNRELEKRVAARTAQLEIVNQELESFSYSVSHDLRAPLRAIDGYTRIIDTEYGELLPENGRAMFDQVRANAKRMGTLIDDLLKFARLGRQPLVKQTVDPAVIIKEALLMLQMGAAEQESKIVIHPLPLCQGDPALLTQVWVNLLSNALKYSRQRAVVQIEVGCQVEPSGVQVYYIKDNGVGFDMRYANKLFGVFQRLHSESQFEGTGVGLALVQRIVTRHGGRIWAASEPDQGATFYFTLGNP